MPFRKMFFLIISVGMIACSYDPTQYATPNAPFGPPRDMGEVTHEQLAEVSGLVASRKNPNALWVHNDSGNDPELYLISTQGKLLGVYPLAKAENYDWEDISIGPGPEADETYLYVGDIGDNNHMYDARFVYRFPEPVYRDTTAVVTDTIANYVRLSYFYRDGAVNVETLLLDPTTQDLYVLTKEATQVQIYQFRFPESLPFRQEAKSVAALPFEGINLIDQLVAGDISPDGDEVLLKTYEHVLYWSRKDTTLSIPELLQLPPDTLPYWAEPQGEAIGFAADGSGYYTLSEENLWADIHLYFYPRQGMDSAMGQQQLAK